MQTLRVLQVLLGIRAYELARVSGVSERELARVEAGRVRPKTETVIALVDAVEQIQRDRHDHFSSRGTYETGADLRTDHPSRRTTELTRRTSASAAGGDQSRP